MSDDAGGGEFARESELVFGHRLPLERRVENRPATWVWVLLGALASVAIVSVTFVMSLGDRYDVPPEERAHDGLSSDPAFWACAVLLVAIQITVLARAIYARSRVLTVIAGAALAFASVVAWAMVQS